MTDIKDFQNTTSFLISRHPFNRIVSAYRNKFQADTRIADYKYIYETLSRHICVMTRGGWKKGDPDPSFEEFVKYLINTKVEQYNGHWQLIIHTCR